MRGIGQNNNSIILRIRVVTSTIVKAVSKVTTNVTSINILRAVAICILVIVIIFCSYANEYEHESVRVGKEILSGIEARSKTSHNAENSNINIKNYQKELDQNVIEWTKNLESKLSKDAKTQKSISIPRIEQTEANKRLATQITVKSKGLINEALGVSQSTTMEEYSTDFLIFVSFAMGEKNIEGLIEKASRYGSIVVLRGLKEGDFKETARFLLKITEKSKARKFANNQSDIDHAIGMTIDPSLFEEYGIRRVPTYILTKVCNEGLSTLRCNSQYDKLAGNVSPRYALEKFSIRGDLREEARRRLR